MEQINFRSESSIEGAYMLDTSPPPGLERMQDQLHQGQADISIALSVLEEEKSGPVRFVHPVDATWFGQIKMHVRLSLTKFVSSVG